MSNAKTIAFVAAAAFMLGSAPAAFAKEGTTLAGPAQGSKSNGEASTKPSGEAETKAPMSGGSNAGKQPTATSEQHEKLGN